MSMVATSRLAFCCAELETELPLFCLRRNCLSYQAYAIKVKTSNLPVAFQHELLLAL